MPAVLWFRRDLRLLDHPALLAAARSGAVLPLFVLDDRLLAPAGPPRVRFLLESLDALDRELQQHGPGLVVRRGRPEHVVPATAAEVGAEAVHVSADHGPYGQRRDERVQEALGSIPLLAEGSPYAVAPGRLRTGEGTPYRVFTAFHRAWLQHGWRAPAASDPADVSWLSAPSDPVPAPPPTAAAVALPEAGEAAAHRAWQEFLSRREEYDELRDRPDRSATSRMSTYLRWGAIHPRTLLADLGPEDDAVRREIAWRDFCAAALHAWPHSARDHLRPEYRHLPYVDGARRRERLEAWRAGRTGYPLVDAGMRELAATGLMHNRVRMVSASFLVKDLKVEWTWGARHFLHTLVDGDLASNQLNWQWVAGSGLDAAPYFRIFNPVRQSEKFDPAGDYIRHWVPELRSCSAGDVHAPWQAPGGPPAGYPLPIVDHAEERRSALEAHRHLRATAPANDPPA